MLRFLLLLITSCAALGPPQVLLVSGSDSGGGAGLQAEIKTCEALGVFSTNAVTAITAQNTVGVHGVHGLPPAFVVEQMDAVFDDFAVDAVKTGLLASVDVVEAVARRLRAADVGGVVVDPVVCAASGDVFVDDATISDQGRAAAARDRDHAERGRGAAAGRRSGRGNALGGPRARRGAAPRARAARRRGQGRAPGRGRGPVDGVDRAAAGSGRRRHRRRVRLRGRRRRDPRVSRPV